MSLSQQQPPQQKGIDVRLALEILASRSVQQQQQRPTGSTVRSDTAVNMLETCVGSGCCHGQDSPPHATTLGQTISLLDDDGSYNSSNPANDEDTGLNGFRHDSQMQHDDQIRHKRKLQEALQSMNVSELLEIVLATQEQRVQAYRNFDRGLASVLSSGNMTNYPAHCAEATALFSVQSDTVIAIQGVLLEQHQRRDLQSLLVRLQQLEKNKLNYTAALHLEKIRSNQQPEQQDDDVVHGSINDPTAAEDPSRSKEQIAQLLRQGIASLQQQIATFAEEINDTLEEIRYHYNDATLSRPVEDKDSS